MLSPLFAMPGYDMTSTWVVGLAILALIAGSFVQITRVRGVRRERDRRAGLGLLAIVAGPLTGASLAWLSVTFGDVHPLDIGFTYATFTMIGTFAGILGGVAFFVTGLLAPHDRGEADARGARSVASDAPPERTAASDPPGGDRLT